jgi:hypothetical protein
MDEIDAQGRQMLLERPKLTRGRLSVFRQPNSNDEWFPHLSVTLKKSGTDAVLWQWATHTNPIDFDSPPPYGEEVMLEKYFELETPLKTPRGLEAVFCLGAGATNRGSVAKFSASLYLYPNSVDERGVQVAVVDFDSGLTSSSSPLYFRVNFPW